MQPKHPVALASTLLPLPHRRFCNISWFLKHGWPHDTLSQTLGNQYYPSFKLIVPHHWSTQCFNQAKWIYHSSQLHHSSTLSLSHENFKHDHIWMAGPLWRANRQPLRWSSYWPLKSNLLWRTPSNLIWKNSELHFASAVIASLWPSTLLSMPSPELWQDDMLSCKYHLLHNHRYSDSRIIIQI